MELSSRSCWAGCVLDLQFITLLCLGPDSLLEFEALLFPIELSVDPIGQAWAVVRLDCLASCPVLL